MQASTDTIQLDLCRVPVDIETDEDGNRFIYAAVTILEDGFFEGHTNTMNMISAELRELADKMDALVAPPSTPA